MLAVGYQVFTDLDNRPGLSYPLNPHAQYSSRFADF